MTEWISRKEREPIEEGKYLVHSEKWGKHVAIAYFKIIEGLDKVKRKAFFAGGIGDGEWASPVTHWMPLPEVPHG